jgi:hypothetical protein
MALSRHGKSSLRRPLSEVERTWSKAVGTSGFDPKLTWQLDPTMSASGGGEDVEQGGS